MKVHYFVNGEHLILEGDTPKEISDKIDKIKETTQLDGKVTEEGVLILE